MHLFYSIAYFYLKTIKICRLWVEGTSRKCMRCIIWLELQWNMQICGEDQECPRKVWWREWGCLECLNLVKASLGLLGFLTLFSCHQTKLDPVWSWNGDKQNTASRTLKEATYECVVIEWICKIVGENIHIFRKKSSFFH